MIFRVLAGAAGRNFWRFFRGKNIVLGIFRGQNRVGVLAGEAGRNFGVFRGENRVSGVANPETPVLGVATPENPPLVKSRSEHKGGVFDSGFY